MEKELAPSKVTLTHEFMGGPTKELPLLKRYISIDNPHTPDSVEKPENATLSVLVWNKDEHVPKRPDSQRIQYVVMGGFATDAVEVHPILTMLTGHADTIVGIAHPDSPQAKITPRDTPFNDPDSFANSGYAILRTIEQLRKDGTLDPHSPVTAIGFSTGAPVLLEATAQDINERNITPAFYPDRRIDNLMLLAPGGILEMGSTGKISRQAAKTFGQYMSEFKPTSFESKNPLKMFAHFLSEFKIRQWLTDTWQRGKNLIENVKALKNWDMSNPAWRSVVVPYILFEIGEFIAQSSPFAVVKDALAHFHVIWPYRPGEPHTTPITAAVKRNQENIPHNVTAKARATITDTPTIIWMGEADRAVPPDKLLTKSDIAQLESQRLSPPNYASAKRNRILHHMKELLLNNIAHTHVLLEEGARSHHISPRVRTKQLEDALLTYIYPGVKPLSVIFTGQSDS